jgi:hypothetical protein
MWRSRSKPTETNKNLYNSASKDFAELVTEFNKLDQRIKLIEDYLELNQVPYTPGRGLINKWKED